MKTLMCYVFFIATFNLDLAAGRRYYSYRHRKYFSKNIGQHHPVSHGQMNCEFFIQLNVWSNWSACSQTCGGFGVRSRSLIFKNETLEKQTEHCGTEDECVVGVWSKWSECSQTCGGLGVRSRSLKFKNQTLEQQTEPCGSEEECFIRAPPGDDTAFSIPFKAPFPYFGISYISSWIHYDGQIVLEEKDITGFIFLEDVFTKYIDFPLIVPYSGVDLTTLPMGNVSNAAILFYQKTMRQGNVSEEVRRYFPQYPQFEATWTLTVKWEAVVFNNGLLTEFFEAVLITDGTNSFVKIFFKKNESAVKKSGFVFGNGTSSFVIPIVANRTEESNVAVPGEFWYSVGGADIEFPTEP